MAAHARVMRKLHALDGSGRARGADGVEPHPGAGGRPKHETELGRLFADGGHWSGLGLGERWRAAGIALAPAHPAEARVAYEWSLHYFELYRREWSAHLPASRWDSDGEEEMEEVRKRMGELAGDGPAAPLAEWAGLLLAGEWRRALKALDDGPRAPELAPLEELLAAACRLGGRKMRPAGGGTQGSLNRAK